MGDTRADQAVFALDVTTSGGLVRVRDGEDVWICRGTAWDAALAALDGREPIEDDDNETPGLVLAYGELCGLVADPVASVIGSSRGEWRALVREAVACGLVSAEEGLRMYGVQS